MTQDPLTKLPDHTAWHIEGEHKASLAADGRRLLDPRPRTRESHARVPLVRRLVPLLPLQSCPLAQCPGGNLVLLIARLLQKKWLQKNTVFKAAVLEDTHARRSCRGRRSVRSGGDAKHKRDRSSHIVQMRFATDTLATAAAVAKMWGLITSGKR